MPVHGRIPGDGVRDAGAEVHPRRRLGGRHELTADLGHEVLAAGEESHALGNVYRIAPTDARRYTARMGKPKALLSFHTFAYAGPMFRHAIAITPGEVVERDGFVFADLMPAQ